MFVTSALCKFCSRVFSFNPNEVPTYREYPVCRECVPLVNQVLEERGSTERLTIFERGGMREGSYEGTEQIG